MTPSKSSAELPTLPSSRPADGPRPHPVRDGALVLGISGARRNATVASAVDGELVAVCEQERLTRVRGIGLQPGVLPSDAIAAVLELTGHRSPSDIRRFVTAEGSIALPLDLPQSRLDHHF